MKKLAGFCLAAVLVLAGCEQPTDDNPGDPALTGTVTITGTPRVGETLTVDTSALAGTGTLAYQWQRSAVADGTFATIDNASGTSYTLVSTDQGQHIRVAISRAGYGGTRTSAVLGPVEAIITWTAEADGAPAAATSTAIAFVFSEAVTGLTADDIAVSNGTGSVTTGALTGGGTNWSLALSAVAAAGNVSVTINKPGIESGGKTVAVYKAGEAQPVSYTAKADGAANATTSTAIAFVFSEAVTGLTAGDIAVSNETGSVTTGALTGGGKNWSLALSAVATAGNVSVTINKPGIESSGQTVAVYKADVSYTAKADGAANATTSTAIAFVFSEAVTGLTAGDIAVSNGTGSVTTGALTGGGTNWSLALSAVAAAGNVSVTINKPGIESSGKTVAVHIVAPENARVVASGQQILFLFSAGETLSHAIDPGLSTGELVKSWTSDGPTIASVQNGMVTALAPGRAVITMMTMANRKREWNVSVLDTAQTNLKTKFGVSAQGAAGVTATLKALHECLPLLPDPSVLVNLGDYIDLDMYVASVNDDFNAFGGNTTSRVIVVGVNPFLGKNGNGDTPHIALHFSGIYGGGKMNLTPTNAGGYKESAMRGYLADHFLPALRKAGVTDDYLWAPKRYGWNAAAGDAGAADLIEDAVWLPTLYEIFGEDYIPVTYTADGRIPLSVHEDANNQVHLEYYDTPARRRKTGQSGSGASWWLASPSPGKREYDANKFCSTSVVGGEDGIGSNNPATTYGIVPAFCVY